MLGDVHFYYRITRKMVVLFGTMFNNLKLYRYNKAGTVELERITVPLSYIAKEKFYQRITQDPELTKETEITLPRMGFELTSVTYDPIRKQSIYNNQFAPGTNNNTAKSLLATPYNFEFTLSIYARNTEDGTQIIEQILPYFNPDFTLSVALTDVPTLKTDIPIILESITYQSDSEGIPDNVRVLTWTLVFTVKGYMYGPTTTINLIQQSTANTFSYETSGIGSKSLQMSGGNSRNYQVGELVYEGPSVSTANAAAFVDTWDNTSHILTVSEIKGILKVGKELRGAITGATYNISSFVINNSQLSQVTVTPNPSNANANDDFGYTETIEEFPNIT